LKQNIIDVEPTAQIIDVASMRLRQSADNLNRIANHMRSKNDLTYAAEALSEVLDALQNSRLDLLITRPIRELQKDV